MDYISQRVGAYVGATGTTRAELAAQLGMSTVTLHSRLTKKTDWKLSEAEALARILGCSIEDLRNPPVFK